MGPVNYLVTDIFQNIFVVFSRRKIHTGLKQLEGEYIMTEFSFEGELRYRFKVL